MVQTRRSLSKSPNETPHSRRQTRKNNTNTLSSTGIISTNTNNNAKKIVFDEHGNAPIEFKIPPEQVQKVNGDVVEEEVKGSDDDDDVEEVKGSDAKLQIQEQRAIERSTARRPKRKRKQKEEEEELEDGFFEQLDAELEKVNKKQQTVAPKGKLITFVAKDDEEAASRVVVNKDHNIQVVVLNNHDHDEKQSGPPAPLVATTGGVSSCSTTTTYSRFHVQDGQDELSAKQLQKAKKTGRKVEQTWTRSNKATQRLLGGRRIKTAEDVSSKATHVVIRL